MTTDDSLSCSCLVVTSMASSAATSIELHFVVCIGVVDANRT